MGAGSTITRRHVGLYGSGGVAQVAAQFVWLCPTKEKGNVAGSIPGHHPAPGWGMCKRQPKVFLSRINVSAPPFPSL